MSRQRVINDGFWRSNRMAGRTVEDRYALFYFLTSPFSNIVGAYEIVISIAASEMGWDSESQMLPVMKRLVDAGYIAYDPESQFVWIRDWWEHNSPKMAVSSKLQQKTFEQIAQLPESWRDAYIIDLIDRLPTQDPLRTTVATEFGYPMDRVSIGYPYPTDRSLPNTTINTRANSISTPTNKVVHSLYLPSALSSTEQADVCRLLAGVPLSDAQMLLDELAGTLMRTGVIKTSPIRYLAGLVKHHKTGDFTPAAGVVISAQRKQRQLKSSQDKDEPPVPSTDAGAHLAAIKASIQNRSSKASTTSV
ncbi:MAG: hypothetical protein EPN62_09945 [Candidimonas sp.]|nr:MAG: hypothetical protein EPN77_03485 [Candidimonas sp.]TAM23178.1 MAG: hypothetical protein EPN62_09945 [Candidimonas sp.]